MTIHAGPLLASLVDLENPAVFSTGSPSGLPLILSLLGILLALLLSLRKE